MYPEPHAAEWCPAAHEGGVLGVLLRIHRCSQVTEAIKLPRHIEQPLLGRLQIYDALEMNWRQLKLRKDPNCAMR